MAHVDTLPASTPERSRSALVLLAFVGVCLLAGALGGLATQSGIGSWYQSLRKPAWNPPSWVFSPVWTTLYVLMGTSAWLVWRERGFAPARTEFGLFGTQLFLNALWSFLFFGFRAPLLALIELVLLAGAVLATLLAFWRVRPLAGALLIPYLAWVTFAGVLNATLWRMNA
ncbi:MAG: TspO/MBR family protein [Myxococcaceae bacterium]